VSVTVPVTLSAVVIRADGTDTWRRDTWLPRAPVEGDWVEPAPGWASERVAHVTFTSAGEVVADLRAVRAFEPDDRRALEAAWREAGWLPFGEWLRDRRNR
jgi:hypothetical protein